MWHRTKQKREGLCQNSLKKMNVEKFERKRRTREDVLPSVFLYLKIFSIWQPLNGSRLVTMLYKMYTIIYVGLYAILVLSEWLNIMLAEEKLATFKELMHFAVTDAHILAKMLIFVIRRDKVVQMIDCCLTKSWNPPRDDAEWKIITNCNRTSKITTTLYMIPMTFCIGSFVFGPLYAKERILPYNGFWYPFDVNASFCFELAYVHQIICGFTTAFVLVAFDCIIAGFMMEISAHLNILSHRLMNTPKFKMISGDKINYNYKDERCFIKECIDCHNEIFRFADLLSATFIEIVFTQFCVTLMAICTTVFFLVQTDPLSSEFLASFFYFLCILVQFFYYCWYGNEVLLNSNELFRATFEADCTKLSNTSNKALLIMMTVAKVPIRLFSGVIIKLNLDSFITVLKLSYSSFNVLKTSL